MHKNAGFTLIELIMVIVILGILAAVAVPRFTDLGGDARAASVKSWAGAIRSAMGMAHSTALATGISNGTVTVDGVNVQIIDGYPSATAGGIGNALANTDTSDLTATYDGNSAVFSPASAADATTCNATYAPQQNGIPPTVVILVTAC
ncbi:MAG: prepilin-type N-terminal cleavage/methylation domain-containing protein [Methylococcaceae bacterium]|nr:MAG: prepilin-type N-terminal cleavage/methylation domain-containing protein [Methylococcaceae bacterium]